jgi:D-serine deaminase-like pyridoxal phosphate-dependent protein
VGRTLPAHEPRFPRLRRDRGAPHDTYFATLNRALRDHGNGQPTVVVDLDRVDRNCDALRNSVAPGLALRVVAKSLPCPRLLAHVMARLDTHRLMVFHAPHVTALAREFPRADLLLGKPLPVAAARACLEALAGTSFDAARQLAWLIDTPERLAGYHELARALGVKLRLSLEIDINLGRGGFVDADALALVLDRIAADPRHLELAGLMGYDAHVGGIPAWLESRDASLARSLARYRAAAELVLARHPGRALMLNGAGSKTIRLHDDSSPVNDVSAGSCLVLPADFDIPLLADLAPAAWIATPVLKVLDGYRIPGLPGIGRLAPLIAAADPNLGITVFVYGGGWRARPASPPGLTEHALFGFSANQACFSGSRRTALCVDDYVFLQPGQSESLLLSFGDLTIVRGAEIHDRWAPLPA